VGDAVGPEHHVGRPVLGPDRGGGRLVEELAEHPDAPGPGEFGDLPGRLDAQVPHTGLRDRREHDAVVAADLDDERVGPGQLGLQKTAGVPLEMFAVNR
jgi:hypothetical protein